ncbi:MAG: ParB/RepB/Spo0J family partition protein [Prevotella sp.]|jgi:ParB family chromosome partitioning protein|nr:ParB/RepB/Spo0J family partition protein [Prevotella sp.]
MTAIKNSGTAVAVQTTEKANEVVTAVVVRTPENGVKKAVNIPADLIEPSNYNARKTFDADALKELAQSISVHGLIQPITVRRKGEKGEHYEIICGERRFRACRMLKLAEIPCIVREVTDEQAYDLSISENLQREDVPPMEAAEAYKRLIDTKRYDIKTLALQFGKSEKHVYQTLKLCELIKDIAKLVKAGKLTASAGIVISKYDKKIQAEILKDRLGEDGQGEWCNISAGVLDGKIQNCYTNNLENYLFDKTPCLKCPHNSTNFDLFATGSGCGRCADKKCLDAKNTAYLVAQAQAIALADPKLVFISDQYSSGCEAKQIIKKGGYEFKNVHTYNLNRYPTAPTAPQASDYKKTEDFDKAQEQYDKKREQYEKKVQNLDALKEQGKIRVYADISRDAVTLHYKEVASKDTKSNEQLIADLTAKKKRNTELQAEKTAEGIKELLRTDELPQSAFTADEETAMYFFMLSKLRRSHYKAIGLKENDYYGLTDEKKLQIASTLTEEQKTVIRRDYLYSHLTDRTATVADTKGGLLLAFAKQHVPKKTAEIEATHAEDYGKKNTRLDERIAGLKKAEKQAKADAKAKKAEQPAKAEKTAITVDKAKKATPTAKPKGEPKDTPKAESTKQTAKATPTPTAGTVHLVTVPPKGKTAEVATAV